VASATALRHVGMHLEHGAMRLEVDAAGVEQDALADERNVGARAAPAAHRAILQVRDAGTALRVAGRHREKALAPRAAAGARQPAQRESVPTGERGEGVR